ncbi:DUF4843 domain-containing protein [Chitinophaga horti]|uniref:DUF4843 domain-containing protein n=1 Tax=Chitinophaga horti TaxID=2920382 RepID=A0ABY6J4A6_9BACT|nr:DUF4843 domain-containing protein [Chitinophaga horti]UYQ94503.1 DUF4843 domain-containing protein [Chitinophaga horti]
MKLLRLYIFLSVGLLSACNQSDLLTFKSSNDIYFNFFVTTVQRDSLNVNFSLVKDVADTFFIPVQVLGKGAPQVRPYTLQVNQQLTTAEAGKHYVILSPADSLAIRANGVDGGFNIIINRPADLREKAFELVLDLVPNEHFTTNMKVFNYAVNPAVKATQWKVKIEDILYRPFAWDASEAYAGTYSRAKLELMIATQSLSLSQFYNSPLYSSTQLNNFSVTMQRYLNAQRAAGNTIYDTDGSVMVMGPAAQ